MIQVEGVFGGGGVGGLTLVVTSGESLPSVATEKAIFLLAALSPGTVFFVPTTPSGVAEDDVWIQTLDDAAHHIDLSDDGQLLRLGLGVAYVRKGMAWERMDAYYGNAGGQWVQFSSSTFVFGVSRDASNPSTILTRTYDAVGLSATSGIGTIPQVSSFDALPITGEMRRCNLAANGTVNAYEGQAGFTLDGTNGDVMVEIPRFWFKRVFNGNNREIVVANRAMDGFAPHPAFQRGGNYNNLPYIYVGAYLASAGAVSRSGVAPQASMTYSTMRSTVAAKGTGWYLLDATAWYMLVALMYIEYANLNTEQAIATGRATAGIATNGTTDTMAGHTGRAAGTEGQVCMKYRGIENLVGNIWTVVDGINFDNFQARIATDPEKWSDNTSVINANYTPIGYSCPPVGGAYVSDVGYNAALPHVFIPNATNGSSTTYFADGLWTAGGYAIGIVGHPNAGSCGAASLSFHVGMLTTTYDIIGYRTMYLPRQ